MTDKEKLEEIQQMSGLSWKELATKIGLTTAQTFTDIRSGRHGISLKMANRIFNAFPEIRKEWLMFGQGPMTKQEEIRTVVLYEGAGNDAGASLDTSRITGTIEVGSSFPRAEIAMRNTSESMIEYPIGSILVMKRVCDINLLVPGTNYLIETDEFCMVKRLQKGKDDAHIALYSSNTATYPDGRLVYEPFEIPMDSVKRVFVVLGYIYNQVSDICKV